MDSLKINLKSSSCLHQGLDSKHHNMEGDRGANPQPWENLLCWAASWCNVKTGQNDTLQGLLNQALPIFLSFFLIFCYSALNFCYKLMQNQQGSTILIYHYHYQKKTPNMHTIKYDSYKASVSFGFSASNGQQG